MKGHGTGDGDLTIRSGLAVREGPTIRRGKKTKNDDLNRKQQLLEQALSILEREVGLYHRDTQLTIKHLVSTYKKKQLELQRASSIMEREVGLDHRDTQDIKHLISTYDQLQNKLCARAA